MSGKAGIISKNINNYDNNTINWTCSRFNGWCTPSSDEQKDKHSPLAVVTYPQTHHRIVQASRWEAVLRLREREINLLTDQVPYHNFPTPAVCLLKQTGRRG